MAARNAFIEQLTDAQLDHVVGRVLQLDLNMHDRYRYMDWTRKCARNQEAVDFNMCRRNPSKHHTFEVMLMSLVRFSEYEGNNGEICCPLEGP